MKDEPKGPMKFKGMYPFCQNKTCTHACAQRITDQARKEAARQKRGIWTIDACAQYLYPMGATHHE